MHLYTYMDPYLHTNACKDTYIQKNQTNRLNGSHICSNFLFNFGDEHHITGDMLPVHSSITNATEFLYGNGIYKHNGILAL